MRGLYLYRRKIDELNSDHLFNAVGRGKSHGHGQYRTISEALKHATAGMTILVKPGLYKESLTISEPVEIVGLKVEEALWKTATFVTTETGA